MRIPAILFVVISVLVAAFWAFVGQPVPMPPSPLVADEKLQCVSYAPFRDGQSPLGDNTVITPEQIDDDLARLAKVTDCVRTYATELNLDKVPEIARKHGLKVLQGIWLGGDPAHTAKEIGVGVQLARQHDDVIIGLIVGNEVLLRGEMSAQDIAATIRRIKERVDVPVTYADVWEFWMRHRELADVVDFVTVHILPYWEDFPVPAEEAGAHIDSIREQVARAFPGKEILIGETGWPSAGRMREGALPSPSAQARALHDILTIAHQKNYRVNVIEGFDQPWKRRLEGTVGGHWGIFDAYTRAPKFAWGQPVVDHPYWKSAALGGILLTGAIFAAAAAGLRRRPAALPSLRWPVWTFVAVSALAAGVTAGWAVAKLPLESLHWWDWLRSGVLVFVAIASPVVAALALTAGVRLPSFAEVLSPRATPSAVGSGLDSTGRLLGWLLIVLTLLATVSALGLVFNPRYLSFPFAAMTGAVFAFIGPAFAGRWQGLPRAARRRGLSETFFAATLAGAAIYIVLNETVSNWQAVWLGGLFLILAASLIRARDGQKPA
ncbi:beta-1,6-glucan synthase [Pseudochelatococcus contaminans]|uniref:Endo-1,3-beta-glucanase btgC n=1 Tax=Pseudochelatococcus contaminans TaxID=1538103 RepID=A0A7W5Z3J0_9HYPH|nr:beta-1,6-glucan synthase [Pseudochelatococcus contaminans]MBB3809427.1 glucan 1,3-beta-glucosidase [Pseudochelatococcus contaminans]